MIKAVDKNGLTILHKWAMMGKLWPFQFLLKQEKSSRLRKDFINLLCATEKSTGNNPLHTAAYYHNEETVQVVQLLVEAYIDAKEQGVELQPSPWTCENIEGDTPLMVSLINKHEKLALYFMSVDMENSVVYATKSVLYCAVLRGCDEVAEETVASVDPACFSFMQLKDDGGRNVLHVASNCTGESTLLLVYLSSYLKNLGGTKHKQGQGFVVLWWAQTRPMHSLAHMGAGGLFKKLRRPKHGWLFGLVLIFKIDAHYMCRES